MVVLQSIRVEHFLQTCRRAVVQVISAIPQALQGRDLVIARSLPRLCRQSRVRASGNIQYVQRHRFVLWDLKSRREGNFVVRVERWRMAVRAALTQEDRLAGAGFLIEWIRA